MKQIICSAPKRNEEYSMTSRWPALLESTRPPSTDTRRQRVGSAKGMLEETRRGQKFGDRFVTCRQPQSAVEHCRLLTGCSENDWLATFLDTHILLHRHETPIQPKLLQLTGRWIRRGARAIIFGFRQFIKLCQTDWRVWHCGGSNSAT
jgi:hypothetical protein